MNRTHLAATAAAVSLLAACSSHPVATAPGASGNQWTSAHPFKAAFIYAGAAGDVGWTQAHEAGRQAVQSYFGGRAQTEFKDSIPVGRPATLIIAQLVHEGNNIIFATSPGYQDVVAAAARTFPTVLFEQVAGTVQAANLADYFGAGEDGDYLSGMAAGFATKTRKIGYVAPFPTPEVIRGIDAYTLGARAVSPNATVRVAWTKALLDPAREQAAARSLVAAGVDVLGDSQDSAATGQVAAGAGIKWTGHGSDQASSAPNSWLTATTYNWGPYYINEVKAAMGGSWRSRFYYGGLGDGFVVMAAFGKSVSTLAQTAISTKQAAIKGGTFNPFSGPIAKQDGTVGVPAGTTLPAYAAGGGASRYSIDWFVRGVIGGVTGA